MEKVRTHLTKTILYYINSYNTFMSYTQAEHVYDKYNLDLTNLYFVLNNNNKWYCLITLYESSNYLFFYDNKGSTFYIQVSKFTNQECLVEGYVYEENNKKVFKVTDILGSNSIIINQSYSKRLELLNGIIPPLLPFLQNLNSIYNFEIHKVYTEDYKQFLSISKQYIETIDDYNKTNVNLYIIENKTDEDKLVMSTKIPDVYQVFHAETHAKQGILYVKTIKDSKDLLNKFSNNCTSIILPCTFNVSFNRWEFNLRQN